MNKRTNFGKIYLLNVNIKKVNKIKVKNAWFTKKKGINWGIIWYVYRIFSYIYHNFTKKAKKDLQ